MVSLLKALTFPLQPDELLAALHPWRGSDRRGVIEAIVPTGRDAASIRIRPGRALPAYQAGQFIVLRVDIDGVRHQRCYSLTSVPDAGGRIEITVQGPHVDPTGRVSVSHHLVHHAKVGDVVEFERPQGDFVLPDDTRQRYLFITGGSGITPIMAMLRSLDRTPTAHRTDVVLIHHVTDQASLLFGAELEQLAARAPWLHANIVTTRSRYGTALADRHLSATNLDAHCPDWRDRETYLCGPDGLLEFAIDHWAGQGRTERLHVERFTPPRTNVADQGEATASFERSGVTCAPASGVSLLVAAEQAGVTAPFGCRAGVCHTCSTRLIDGEARDQRDGRTSGPGSHIQLCVTTAVDHVTLDL